MDSYDPSIYGELHASVYDEHYEGLVSDGEAEADLLAELAKGGRVLELGVGTGRIALPLARRGVDVCGLDASSAMVARLRTKPDGELLQVILGDFSDFELGVSFSVVFVVFNTLFALPSQEAQVACFRRVATHLEEDGLFVVEAFVPDPARLVQPQRVAVRRMGLDFVELEVSQPDPVAQTVQSHTVRIAPGGVELYPVNIRYAWPSELDLMAELAGLSLRHRWAGWRKEPFGSASPSHVSVYAKN